MIATVAAEIGHNGEALAKKLVEEKKRTNEN
jgi:hypothetical protein